MGKGFLTSYTTILVSFPNVVIKKSNSREKSIFFSVSQMKVQSPMMGKSKEQELEAAGHIVSPVSPRESKGTPASAQLFLST